jgi:hypothetical protein
MSKNRIVSFNTRLCQDFVKHIENTNNVCLYKLGNHNIPHNLFFPNARALTLINCSKNGILNILHPRFFPNINTINYLSMGTGNNTVYSRFNPDTRWNFPDKNYEYYNFMVGAGYGKKDPEIIKTYISNKRLIDGKNGFDISYELDLNIPGYGVVNGEWWISQLYEYMVVKQNENVKPDYIVQSNKQEFEEELLKKEYTVSTINDMNFEDMIEMK